MNSVSVWPVARRWANEAANLIFPPVCAGCGKLGAMLCDSCQTRISKVTLPICHRCGCSLPYPANVCTSCTRPSFHLQQVRAPLFFNEPLRSIIHKLKYDSLFALATPLAKIMVQAWPAWEKEPNCILPIPLHKRRQRERGFNQSALLAGHIGRRLNIPVFEDGLRRIRNTAPQIDLNPEQRRENVRDAFAASNERVSNHNVLLIDDVYTTGATMLAATDALLTAGAASVSAYCLARAS